MPPTCHDVHAVALGALFDDALARLEAGHHQQLHHHRRLLLVQPPQEVVLLDGIHDHGLLTGGGRGGGGGGGGVEKRWLSWLVREVQGTKATPHQFGLNPSLSPGALLDLVACDLGHLGDRLRGDDGSAARPDHWLHLIAALGGKV